mgnify:FL=1
MAALPKVAFFVRIFALRLEKFKNSMETNKPEIGDSEKGSKTDKSQKMTTMKALSFSLQFGLMIVIPLAIFALVGKWLAGRYDNKAYYYGALALAILTSSIWFYKKINDLYKNFIDPTDSDK